MENMTELTIESFSFEAKEFKLDIDDAIVLFFYQSNDTDNPWSKIQQWDKNKKRYTDIDIDGLNDDMDVYNRYPRNNKFVFMGTGFRHLALITLDPLNEEEIDKISKDPDICRLTTEQIYYQIYTTEIHNKELTILIRHSYDCFHYGSMSEFSKICEYVTNITKINCRGIDRYKNYWTMTRLYVDFICDVKVNNITVTNPIPWKQETKNINRGLSVANIHKIVMAKLRGNKS